ncbi:unnamed protein product [Lactuca virosa]|uniref:Uncharacterized protein n=1 Tax=Lactuca virosa TaxID=75947 RepID=A0AAU9PR01_9ASTR|nr:unnamed protein product [Lactuca virosa]
MKKQSHGQQSFWKMSCLNLSTNVSLEGIDASAILSEATSTVVDLIGKPKALQKLSKEKKPPFLINPCLAFTSVILESKLSKGSVTMAFGGCEQPTTYGELVSIADLNPNVKKKLSVAVAEILSSKLSVPKSRFFLKFFDSEARLRERMSSNSI